MIYKYNAILDLHGTDSEAEETGGQQKNNNIKMRTDGTLDLGVGTIIIIAATFTDDQKDEEFTMVFG